MKYDSVREAGNKIVQLEALQKVSQRLEKVVKVEHHGRCYYSSGETEELQHLRAACGITDEDFNQFAVTFLRDRVAQKMLRLRQELGELGVTP